MKPICIATITRARTEAEEDLLRRSLAQLSGLGLPLFVTDGGSPPAFLNWLKTLPQVTVLPTAVGVFAQARSSLQAAVKSGAPFVFYTEPDKHAFFSTHLPNVLQQLTVTETTGVVLMARSAKGFASFPRFQQLTETTINACCAERTGLTADYCYGPFLVNAGLISSLANVPDDVGWGWRPFVFQTAQSRGYRIDVEERDFFCPDDQREDDSGERLYRMKQLEQNIRGLVLAAERN